MNTTRVGVRALRQAKTPSAFFSPNLPRLAAAATTTTTSSPHSQARGAATTTTATTQKLKPGDGQEILAAQRKQRPVAPHITIYDHNQIWLGASIWTRITGMMFTGGVYAFGAAYLAAPLTGWHLESASLVAAFAGLPLAAKASLKFLAAWPFAFHLFNGTRHLAWDLAKGFNKKVINQGSWAIWGLSLGTALGLALLV